jgi:hypothetical protein
MLFVAGLVGTAIILFNVARAYRRRRHIIATLIEAPEPPTSSHG